MRARAKREAELPHPTLVPADHDLPRRTVVKELGEAERPLQLGSGRAQGVFSKAQQTETEPQC